MNRSSRLRSRLAALALLVPLALAASAAAEEPAKPEAKKPADAAVEVTHGITGTIVLITADGIAVNNLEEGSHGRGVIALTGDKQTPVTGTKKSWEALARGDMV